MGLIHYVTKTEIKDSPYYVNKWRVVVFLKLCLVLLQHAIVIKTGAGSVLSSVMSCCMQLIFFEMLDLLPCTALSMRTLELE